MGFFSSVKGFFQKAGEGIKKAASSVAKFVKTDVAPVIKNAVTTVYNDTKGFISKNQDIIQSGVTGVKDVALGAEKTIGSLGSSLAMPLVIGGAAILGILLLKR